MNRDADITTQMTNGKPLPWHKLGTPLNRPATAKDAVVAAALNWTVAKKATNSFQNPPTSTAQYLLVREDLWNEGARGVLGPVHADYMPLQNVDAFNFLDPIVQSGAAFYDSAGVLEQGKWVWIILRFLGNSEVAANDFIGQFLLFGNSPTTGDHRLTYLPVRLTSGSTLSESHFHNPAPAITVPAVRPRRFQVSPEAALAEIQRHFRNISDEFRAMLGLNLSQEQLQRYLTQVFDDWLKKQNLRKQGPRPASDNIQREQYRDACVRLFGEGKGNDVPGVTGTLWAAYNAIAEYVDGHKLKEDDPMYLYAIWYDELKISALKIASQMTSADKSVPR